MEIDETTVSKPLRGSQSLPLPLPEMRSNVGGCYIRSISPYGNVLKTTVIQP